MGILCRAVLALMVCATGWTQSVKPEVDWGLVDRQMEHLRSVLQARDIEASKKAADTLADAVHQQWMKTRPTPADYLQQAEDRAASASPKTMSRTLPYLAMMAFQAGEFNKAEQYARQTLLEPSEFYDSVHAGNIVLGLLALRNDDVTGAENYLLTAARTKGSMILDRWGPNLALAKALLGKGRNDVVLEYFQLCKSFVTKNPKLDDWIATLKGGRAPDLSHEYLWQQ